jgi:type I restriction enzyme S subunit
MAVDWLETTVGEQATLQRGIDITKRDQRDGPIPVISSGGISSHHDTATARGPGVVLGRKGVVGSVYFCAGDYWPHDTTLWVKDFHGNDPRFVYYFFKWMAPTIAGMDVGSANPTLNRNHVHPIEVSWPPLAEQRGITQILGTLDDKIELNRRMNETLEAMARALFKSWFVDFDPVRAKAEGRDSGLSPHIASLFPDRFEESELGEIPAGWDVLSLGELITLDKGLSYKGAFLAEQGLPMVNLGCFGGKGRFVGEAVKHYSGEFKQRHVAAPGDIVIANTDITQRREVLGSPAIIPPQPTDKVIFTHHVFAARLKDTAGDWTTFIFLLLLQDGFRERAAGYATGTTVLALPREALLDLRFVAPPSSVVAEFGRMASPLFERRWHAEKESRTLAAVRDALLPKLISGELRLKDAERVPAAAT